MAITHTTQMTVGGEQVVVDVAIMLAVYAVAARYLVNIAGVGWHVLEAGIMEFVRSD